MLSAIFNSKLADSIQFLSLGFEAIGLILVIIEVKYPKTAREIENTLGRLSNAVATSYGWRQSYNKVASAKDFSDYRLGDLVWRCALVAVAVIMFGPYYYMSNFALAHGVHMVFIIVGFVGYLIATVFAIIGSQWILQRSIDALHKFSDGRALGTVGLFFATLGFVGECYQATTLLVGG